MSSLIEKLITNRTFTLTILIILILIFSVFSWVKIPIEVMPKDQIPPFLFIRVSSDEISKSNQMEVKLTKHVESMLKTIPKVMKTSSSTDEKGVSISMYLEAGTDLDFTILLAQESLQNLDDQGVLKMKNVSFSKLNPDANSVIKLALSFNEKNEAAVNSKLIEELKAKIESWNEVSKIEISGLDSKIYSFKVPLQKILNSHLKLPQFWNSLTNTEMRENLGDLSFKDAKFEIPLSASLQLESLDMLLDRKFSQQSGVSLNDLDSPDVYEKYDREWSHKNGLKTVFVDIFAKDGADLFNLNKKMSTLLNDFDKNLLKSDIVLNRIDDIKSALDEVFSSLYQALLITFFVVILFYRNLRTTVLVSISIPVTLIITVGMMYLKGETLNILSLSGLILGIGMVVDNAILILGRADELSLEMPNKLAAAKASKDVFLPLALSTLTNAVIFLPVAFIEGGDSFTDLLKAMQVPIVSSLFASIFVALFIMPALILLWPLKVKINTKKAVKVNSNNLESYFRWIQKKKMLLVTCCLMVTYFVGSKVIDLEQSDIESPPDPYVQILIRFSGELTTEIKRDYFASIDKQLIKNKELIGYQFAISDFNPNLKSGVWTLFPPKSENQDLELAKLKEKSSHFIKEIKEIAGSHLSLQWDSWGGGKSQKFYSVQISGPSTNMIYKIQESLKEKILEIKDVVNVVTEKEASGQKELDFTPDLSQLASKQIKTQDLISNYSSLLRKTSLNFKDENTLKVSIESSIGLPWSLDLLESLSLESGNGQMLTLSDFGEKKVNSSNRSISRKEGISTQKLLVYFPESIDAKKLEEAQGQVKKIVNNYNFPAGYGLPVSESYKRIQEMKEKSNFVLLLSGFLIYLILASLFESIFIPIGMMLTVPIALIYGAGGLIPFHLDLDVMARLALVILVGVGVNNAIIIIDLIRNLKDEGLPQGEAIIQGCCRRFKAVMLSTTIQVVSVLPVALGQSKLMGIPYSSLGIVIIFGMIFSTLITLIVLPMIYQFFDDFESSW